MRHALILRTLRLPLIAAVCICGFVVATTAFTRFPLQSRQAPPTSDLPITSGAAADLGAHDRPTTSQPDLRIDWHGTELTPVSTVLAGSDDERGLDPTDRFDSAEPSGNSENQEDPGILYESICDWISEFIRENFGELNQAADYLTCPVVVQQDAESSSDSESASDQPADQAVDGDLSSIPNSNDDAITLTNSAANGVHVSFLIDDQVVQLEAGSAHTTSAEQITVHFDSGGGRGTESQSLAAGRYEFRLTHEGWILQPEAQ